MKVNLGTEDYESISKILRVQLLQLMPDAKPSLPVDFIFGPEFMAEPLRISTPSTQVKFSSEQKEYMKTLKEEINKGELSPEEKKQKLQQLDSMILFGQLLFSQSASLHFLNKPLPEPDDEVLNDPVFLINIKMKNLQDLVQKEGVQYDSSETDTLIRRKKFNDTLDDLKHTIKDSRLSEKDKEYLLGNLSKAKDFYYQANDLNYQYANKPERSYFKFIDQINTSIDNYVDSLEDGTLKSALGASAKFIRSPTSIAVTASVLAMGCTALSFIPGFAPVTMPLAIGFTAISLAISLPSAFKSVGTMLYNLIRFDAAPTPAELTNTALLGTSLLLAGTGGAVGQAVTAGVMGQAALHVTQGVSFADNLAKVSMGVVGESKSWSVQDRAKLYKAEVQKMRPKEQAQEQTLDTSDTKHTDDIQDDASLAPKL